MLELVFDCSSLWGNFSSDIVKNIIFHKVIIHIVACKPRAKNIPRFWGGIHFCRHNFADSGIIVYLESLINNRVDRSFNIKFKQKLVMLITFWFTVVGACSAILLNQKAGLTGKDSDLEEKKLT